MAGTLHFIDEPVPVPGGLDGDLAPFGELAEKVGGVLPNMFDPNRGCPVSWLINRHKNRVSLVRVASDELLHLGTSVCATQSYRRHEALSSAFIRSPRNGRCRAPEGALG